MAAQCVILVIWQECLKGLLNPISVTPVHSVCRFDWPILIMYAQQFKVLEMPAVKHILANMSAAPVTSIFLARRKR